MRHEASKLNTQQHQLIIGTALDLMSGILYTAIIGVLQVHVLNTTNLCKSNQGIIAGPCITTFRGLYIRAESNWIVSQHC